ncbi:discoidin domain-containing protein [Acinetobacter sp. ANC 4636]
MSSVNLTWDAVGQIDSYKVYRSTSPMNPASLPAPLATGITAKSYSDATISQGSKYYYRVGAVKNGIEKLSEEYIVYAINSYSYYRLFIKANNGDYCLAINEIEMFEIGSSIDATNPTRALTFSSCSQFSTVDNSQAFKAFDNDFTLLNNWVVGTQPPSGSIPVSYPAWISYQFDSKKAIDRIKIYPQPRSDLLNRPPKDFVIQGSNDGTSWVDIKSFTNVTGWNVNIAKTFNLVNGTYI